MQRQPSQTQTQRYGRSQRRREDEDDAEEIVAETYEDEDQPDVEDSNTVRAAYISVLFVSFLIQSGFTIKDLKKRATDLVRLALFNEQRRMPLRRDEISKKVMGSQRGTFKAVFDEAQKILRGTFGMELIELPTRAATHDTAASGTGRGKTQEKTGTQNGTGDDDAAGGRQAVTGLRKKGIFL